MADIPENKDENLKRHTRNSSIITIERSMETTGQLHCFNKRKISWHMSGGNRRIMK